jgi:hypothetical protein
VRLVIREYLSMLRESGELDALLPDLLLAMGIEPLTRPGRGIRQFGVDVPAVGIDPEDGRMKLFLFTVKRGNITRADWDGGPQSVRPSLNEILDSYLHNRVRPEHAALPKKIVLATGGELRPEVEPNWRDFAAANGMRYPQLGPIEFDFWGGDKLAMLIERYFLDEYLFPESAQKDLRKTIALADQNEDDPRHFYALVEATLFDRGLTAERTQPAERQRQKAFRLLNLSLNIVFHWCSDVGNLRPALLCGEHAVLRAWDWLRQHQLHDNDTMREEFEQLFDSYLIIAEAYAEKLRPYCFVRDGLFGHGADDLEYPLRTFEVIGIFGTLAVSLVYSATTAEDEAAATHLIDRASHVSTALEALVANNPAAFTPRYDEHAIDITLGLVALTVLGSRKAAAEWVDWLAHHVVLAFRLGRHFPIATDSYDDLVALHASTSAPAAAFKKKLMQLSTLLPMLGEFCAVLELRETLAAHRHAVVELLKDINLQLWQPDEVTEQHLYRVNAARESGYSITSIELPPTTEEMVAEMRESLEREGKLDVLSCVAEGWPALGLIASRHFRTPVIPAFWRELLPLSAHASDVQDLSDVGEEDALVEARPAEA